MPRPMPIDYSDIAPLAGEQLRGMQRVGRPPLGDSPRQLIAIRIDSDVLETVRRAAKEREIGYQTLINDILARYVRERRRRYDTRPDRTRTSSKGRSR